MHDAISSGLSAPDRSPRAPASAKQIAKLLLPAFSPRVQRRPAAKEPTERASASMAAEKQESCDGRSDVVLEPPRARYATQKGRSRKLIRSSRRGLVHNR